MRFGRVVTHRQKKLKVMWGLMTSVVAISLAALLQPAAADNRLIFSAGFSDNAVFQRSATDGAMVYGFTSSSKVGRWWWVGGWCWH